MYCRNCGVEMLNNVSACTNCGMHQGAGNNYCQNCGAYTDSCASVCTKCGRGLKNSSPGAKSKIVAGILAILLGGFGVHNFYLGYYGKGLAQILISFLSCGTLAIVSVAWGIAEGIMILTGTISTDSHGAPLGE